MTLYQAKENSSHDVRGAPDRSTGEWWRTKTFEGRFAGKTPKLPSSKRNTNGAFGNQAKSKFWSYFKKKQKSA